MRKTLGKPVAWKVFQVWLGLALGAIQPSLGQGSFLPSAELAPSARTNARRPEPFLLENGSFETGLAAWDVRGSGERQPGGYSGKHGFVLSGDATARLAQERTLAEFQVPLVPGLELEGGAWVQLKAAPHVPAFPRAEVFVELRILGVDPATSVSTLLASGRWYPTLPQQDDWIYLKAKPIAALNGRERSLRIELRRSFDSPVEVDFLQWGPKHSLDGNPAKLVGCSYVGRYRAPQFATGSDPGSPAERWRNWHWQVPTACSSSFSGFFHSPDCAGGAPCRRENGRRDSAASPLQSAFDLPLVGSYDSRDPAILRYHVALAEAAGIDHFVYDYQGQALALQDASHGRDPINAQTFDALLEVCDKPEVDLKLSVMYEPKVHMLGWVLGQPSKSDKVAGITQDLVWLANRMDGMRCALTRNGRLVVFLFRNGSCDLSGTQCLTDGDWNQIHGAVLSQTGVDLFLIGDTAPGPSSSIQGLTRWQLFRREYLAFRTWTDARDGTPSLPLAVLSSLVQHVRELDLSVRSWVNQLPAERLGILTVWPGFDDSGVGGWGLENLLGEDGAPLCVRIADPLDGAFYSTTVAAAFDGGYDWVQIATWNDWNEATRIEPAWHREFFAPVPLGQGPPVGVTEQVFGRLLETRQWIEAFKGQPVNGASFRAITRDYFSFAWQSATSPLYD